MVYSARYVILKLFFFCKMYLVCYLLHFFYVGFIFVDHEQLARSGTHCFEHLIISSGPKFQSSGWNSTCKFVKTAFQSSLPEGLLTWKASDAVSESDYY